MKHALLALFLLVSLSIQSQNTLFDDSRVNSVYITIDADSLAVIYSDVLSDHYFKARFIYAYDSGKDTLEQVGFRLRGNTSRFSQKKSFKISFNEYVPGRRYQEVKKINLNGQHNDPTLIREKLFYDCWKKSGFPERRTSFVRLYINESYYGLYTNLEEFDKDWLERAHGENEGNLYKCTYPADLVYLGSDLLVYKNIPSGAATGGRAYDLQTNEAEDDYSDLLSLIATLTITDDSIFKATAEQVMNVEEFLKAFALDVATGNWDDYMYNKNNYFLYHNQLTGKFDFISYDTDNTFGVDWMDRDWATRNCLDWVSHSESRPLATKLFAIPEYAALYRYYLDSITRYITSPDTLFPLIDHYKSMIYSAVAEDNFRTLDYGYTLNDFANGFTATVDNHTPYGIKPFLALRQDKTFEQLQSNGIMNKDISDEGLTLFPNPAHESLRLKSTSSFDVSSYRVIDIQGKVWLQGTIEPGRAEKKIRVSDLVPGVYLIRIETGSRQAVKRFIKL